MAERMSTATRMDRARDNGAITRAVNSGKKRKERVTRDARMKALIKKGSYPYTPGILNWASLQLNKPASKLTADEIKKLA